MLCTQLNSQPQPSSCVSPLQLLPIGIYTTTSQPRVIFTSWLYHYLSFLPLIIQREVVRMRLSQIDLVEFQTKFISSPNDLLLSACGRSHLHFINHSLKLMSTFRSDCSRQPSKVRVTFVESQTPTHIPPPAQVVKTVETSAIISGSDPSQLTLVLSTSAGLVPQSSPLPKLQR